MKAAQAPADQRHDRRVSFRKIARLFVAEALRGVLRHKGRSALSVLGILIGIALVVWVVAIGHAGAARTEEQFRNLGDNLIWVEAGGRNVNGVRTGTHDTITLTIDDADAIAREIRLVKSVSPNADGRIQVTYGHRNWNTQYRGVSPEYLDIKRWTVARGAELTVEQVEHVSSVCLIGQTVREQLFGGADPIGETINIQGQLFEVIGVLGRKGPTANGQDQDDTIFMPYTTAQARIRGKGFVWLDDILCSAVSPEAVEPAIDAIVKLLRQRHHIGPEKEDDFNIRRPDMVIRAQVEAAHTLALFLTVVASISLLVGGIGIMNVMLASVVSRTTEIGLRLSVGATGGAVLLQFLGEAVMLTLSGGLMGVLVSPAGSYVIGRALDWQLAIHPPAVAIALAFSVGVGILCGLYPAWRASRLDPIAALRHE